MKITYLSHSCFIIETQAHKLIIDPFLNGNPKAEVRPADIDCDFVLITHGHNDHLGDSVEIAKRNNATIIANYEVAMYCARQQATVHPMHIGGSRDFPFGRVKLTIAHHGSGFESGDDFVYMGNPAGLLISAAGKTVYHAGDTGLFLDMKLIAEMNPIDVAMLPIGDNFTMGIEDAAKAVEFLKPSFVIPMHFGTFDLIDVDPRQFADRVAKMTTPKVLGIGASMEI